LSYIIFFYKNLKLFLLSGFLLISGFFWHWNNTWLVSLRIHTHTGVDRIIELPKKDRERLEYLFRELLIWDGGIYTLMGSKPMSFGGYVKLFSSLDWLALYHSLLPCNIKMYLGWQTWLKYQDFFAHSKFALWAEESLWWEEANAILLVNKEKAASLVRCYEQDFCTILQKDKVSIEDLLEQAKSQPLLHKVLKKHEGLVGTLLGYGRENAWLFHRRSLGENISLSSAWDAKPQIEILNKLHGWTSFFGNTNEDIFAELFCPNFAADLESQETEQLKESYSSCREKIIAAYKGKDFLDTTLSFLMN
jgi:hypothetical protein